MASDQESALPYNPDEQLARLQSWCRDTAPAFYADQSDYLRLLRERLPSAVHRALGHLLCSVDHARLNQLSDPSRHSLQQRIDELIQRCSSLLTIEQLQLLAKELNREKRTRRRQAQQSMMESLQRSSDQAHQTDQQGSAPDSFSDDGMSGSVQLSLAPPVDQPALLDGLLPPVNGEQKEEASFTPSDEDVALESELDLSFEDPPSTTDQDEDGDLGVADQASSDLDVLRSLFLMAGQAMDASEDSSLSDPSDEEAAGSDSDQLSSEFMPTMPLELMRWLDGLDLAVVRRLRNLSHAINVELLRAGLTTSLLPISLLDAVHAGQVDTLPTASNLLRLRVPLPMTGSGDQLIDLCCVLLRPSELEFDLVPLRRCRSRLRQRKQSLLTMVRQQRHWQRRAQTQHVQHQWWPSPPTSPPTHPPQS